MTVDLPPDVRAEAARDAKTALRSACGTSISINAAVAMVKAVVAVVAPEIARPLKARIEELKTENLHLSLEIEARDDAQWDLHQRLLPALVEAKGENRRLHDVVHRERPSVGDMVIELPQLRADRGALQARVEELEAQRAELLERCRQADLSKALPDLSTGEVRRALGIPPLGGPDA